MGSKEFHDLQLLHGFEKIPTRPSCRVSMIKVSLEGFVCRIMLEFVNVHGDTFVSYAAFELLVLS